jgi:hypothetical protein
MPPIKAPRWPCGPNPQGLRLQQADGGPFELSDRLQSLCQTGQLGEWPVWIPHEGRPALAVRLCVVRKTQAAIALTQAKLRRSGH